MSMKKMSIGSGYDYYARQTAVGDGQANRANQVHDYYSEHGERPGIWWGKGLAGLNVAEIPGTEITVGDEVTMDQIESLFGVGRHPNAKTIEDALVAGGARRGFELSELDLGARYMKANSLWDPYNQTIRRLQKEYRDAHGMKYHEVLKESVKAEIRATAGVETFKIEYGREPDKDELRGIMLQAHKRPKGNCGIDFTFTPPKSVSVAWGLTTDPGLAEAIMQCHREAVAEAMSWMEDTLLFTRRGENGVRQVETKGMIANIWEHRDSRTGDPNLHTHVTVANKVQADDGSGKWLSIDARVLYAAKVAASERYNLSVMRYMSQRLGAEWEATRKHVEGPPIWELAGVHEGIRDLFSSRRHAIAEATTEMVQQFAATHGREPLPEEMHHIQQKATLATRPAKHESRSEAEQRQAWLDQALERYSLDDIETMLAAVTAPLTRLKVSELTDEEIAAEVLAQVLERRSVFSEMHLDAEAARQLKSAGVYSQDRIPDIVNLCISMSVPLARPEIADAPVEMQRTNGESVYSLAHAATFTTRTILDAEQRCVDAAGLTGGHAVPTHVLARALTVANEGPHMLDRSQAEMVREFTQSRRRVQAAVAPAGTGKTTAMKVVADAWRAAGGNVVALSHQATAAKLLADALGDSTQSATLMSLTTASDGRNARRKAFISLDTAEENRTQIERDIRHGTLVIIDEASMADTRDLVMVIDYAVARGADVRLIGDVEQIGAVGSGGVLRDIQAVHGAVNLTEVHRFRNPYEAQATLAVRDGDHSALGWYANNQRIKTVTPADSRLNVFDGWKEDKLEKVGVRHKKDTDALMLATRVEDVKALSDSAQQWLIEKRTVHPSRGTAHIRDDAVAHVGDIIVTLRNDKYNRLANHDYVKNRDRWIVQKVFSDNRIRVKHMKTGHVTMLSGEYVRDYVDLGYAMTITAAQGMTVDKCRILATGDETRNLLYVALSRGVKLNQVYMEVGGDLEAHDASWLDVEERSRSAAEKFLRILDRSPRDVSATTTIRESSNPFTVFNLDAHTYLDAVYEYARTTLGVEEIDRMGRYADLLMGSLKEPRPLTMEPAWDALVSKLAYLHMLGYDWRTTLTDAAKARPLVANTNNPAHDMAAVLHWRIPAIPALPGCPFLPSTPTVTAESVGAAAETQRFLDTYAGVVDAEETAIREMASGWTPDTAPRWAVPLLEVGSHAVPDLAVYRAYTGVAENSIMLIPDAPTGHNVALHTWWQQIRTMVQRDISFDQWTALVHPLVARDHYFPFLCAQLDASIRTGRMARLDVETFLAGVLDRGAPIESPALSLWSGVCSTVTIRENRTRLGEHAHTIARPQWATDFLHQFPDDQAQRLTSDPQWLRFVGTVTALPPDVDRSAMLTYGLKMSQNHGVGLGSLLSMMILDINDTVAQDQHDSATETELDPNLAPDEQDLAWYISELEHTQTDNLPPDPSITDPDWDVQQAAWFALVAADEPPELDDITAAHQIPDYAHGQSPRDQLLAREQAEAEAHGFRSRPEQTPSEPSLLNHATSVLRTPIDRIYELNNAAARYFEDHYNQSWAAPYMQSRFGTNLAGDPRWRIGYSPITAGVKYPVAAQALYTHFISTGIATEEELLDAGLVKHDSRGNIIDVFRDRVIVTLINPDRTVAGFQGRAKPGTESEKNPKYLNTTSTPVFTKSDILFGGHLLTADTTPVIVEGPMDAIAVTLASDNADFDTKKAVGVASCGTGFTTGHARIITDTHRQGSVVIGFDTDTAGRKALAKTNHMLITGGLDTRLLPLHGKDPADTWATTPEMLTGYVTHPDVLPYATSVALASLCDQEYATYETRRHRVLIDLDSTDPNVAHKAATVYDHMADPWEKLAPVLGEALQQLPTEQREPVALHLAAHLDEMGIPHRAWSFITATQDRFSGTNNVIDHYLDTHDTPSATTDSRLPATDGAEEVDAVSTPAPIFGSQKRPTLVMAIDNHPQRPAVEYGLDGRKVNPVVTIRQPDGQWAAFIQSSHDRQTPAHGSPVAYGLLPVDALDNLLAALDQHTDTDEEAPTTPTATPEQAPVTLVSDSPTALMDDPDTDLDDDEVDDDLYQTPPDRDDWSPNTDGYTIGF